MNKKIIIPAFCLTFLAFSSGCAMLENPDATTGESKVNSTTWGTGLGAVGGAALGQIIGKDTKSTLIGTAVGGAIGAGIGYSMDRQESDLRKELMNSGVQVKREGNAIVLLMRDKIAFATNKDQLQPEIYPALNAVAKTLKRYPKTNMHIAGFTDNTGSNSYNQLLSKSRAQSVGSYLVGKGFPAKRMQIQGFGPAHPACSNATSSGRACNRRVEISLYSTAKNKS